MTKARVLYLNNFRGPLLGGGERHLLNLAEASRDVGYEVFGGCMPRSGLAKALEEIGVESISMNLMSSNILGTLLRLKKILRKKQVDILHSHGFFPNNLGRLAGRLAKTPIIISTVHCEPDSTLFFDTSLFAKIKQFFRNQIDNFTSRYCHAIIAVSEAVKTKLIKQGISPSKIHSIPNGVRLESILAQSVQESPNKLNIQKEDKIIGTLGRLESVKGLEYFLQAVSLIKKQKQKTKFVIVGDGPLKKELKGIVGRLNLSKDVVLTGFLYDTAAVLNQMNIYVLPSLSEGLNLTLLEALALGKPVIATSVGGNPEVIINNKTGVLVPPKDPKALAEAIIFVLEHKQKAKKMAVEGKNLVIRRFTTEKMVKETLALYEKLLKKRGDRISNLSQEEQKLIKP